MIGLVACIIRLFEKNYFMLNQRKLFENY